MSQSNRFAELGDCICVNAYILRSIHLCVIQAKVHEPANIRGSSRRQDKVINTQDEKHTATSF
jgi:hypothetical protein